MTTEKAKRFVVGRALVFEGALQRQLFGIYQESGYLLGIGAARGLYLGWKEIIFFSQLYRLSQLFFYFASPLSVFLSISVQVSVNFCLSVSRSFGSGVRPNANLSA